MDHLPKSSLVARQIEKHPAIAFEQVRRGAQPSIRPGGRRVHDDVETVCREVFAYFALFQQIELGGRWRQHLIDRGELLRQIPSNEARPAGDKYAHYAGGRKENFLCPTKLYTTINAVRIAPAM